MSKGINALSIGVGIIVTVIVFFIWILSTKQNISSVTTTTIPMITTTTQQVMTTTTTLSHTLGNVNCSRFVWDNAAGGGGTASCENGTITINRVSSVKMMGNTAAGYGSYGHFTSTGYSLWPIPQIDVNKPYELNGSFEIVSVDDRDWLRIAFVILVRTPDNSGRYLEYDVWRGKGVSLGDFIWSDVVEVQGMQVELGKKYNIIVPFSDLVQEHYGKIENVVWSYFVIESTDSDAVAKVYSFNLYNK